MLDTVAPLKILLVEDSQADADLILRQLRELPREFRHVRVASEVALCAALSEFQPDVILSDFRMPGFSGQQALKLAMTHAPTVPFLFVSGTIGEELAIDTLQNGAIDYVLKDNLRRLPSAIARAMDIAESRRARERMERELRESEERFRTIVENSNDWIWECDIEGRRTYSNSAVIGILGYTPAEVLAVSATDLMLQKDRKEADERLPQIVAHKKGWHNLRQRWHHRDGTIRVLESTATPCLDDNGAVVGFRGVDHDITESLHQEARIRHLARIHAVLSALGNVVLRASTREQLLQRMCQIAVEYGGFTAACISRLDSDQTLTLTQSFGDAALIQYVAGLGAASAFDPSHLPQRPGFRAIRENCKIIVRTYATDRHVSAQRRAEMAALGISAQIALPIGNPPWGVMGLYAVEPRNFDEEEQILLQRLTDEIDYGVSFIAKSERLEFLAYRNPVSGLYNRVSFHSRLQPRLQIESMAVALVDISRFATINASRGRAFGDRVLMHAGHRLRQIAHPETIVAHLEADTFALAYRIIANPEVERESFEDLIREFEREPFMLDEDEIRLDLRCGIAFAPEHGTTAETLEHNALSAMLEGNRRGLKVNIFNDELRSRAGRKLKLENELRRALENHEFEVFYQPKFDAANHRLAGAEALLRWRQPQSGMVSPAEFIPLLEESDLIIPVGRWVMREALRTAIDWRERHPGLRISVNVSSRELRHSRFIETCTELLRDHADDPLIDIEVTESLLMDDISESMMLLQALRDLGCRVAIDDFGTGYSSLNYLARLPVDEIKIDQSFVSLMTQSPETMGLVTNIINLARSLSLATVAEGVEEEDQMKLLRLLRCDQLQGFLLGRPMSSEDFVEQFLCAPG